MTLKHGKELNVHDFLMKSAHAHPVLAQPQLFAFLHELCRDDQILNIFGPEFSKMQKREWVPAKISPNSFDPILAGLNRV